MEKETTAKQSKFWALSMKEITNKLLLHRETLTHMQIHMYRQNNNNERRYFPIVSS